MSTNTPPTPSLTPEARARLLLEARYRLFDRFVLADQRSFYDDKVRRHRRAASEVNFLRALCALLTITSTAVATYLTQTVFLNDGTCAAAVIPDAAVSDCNYWRALVGGLFVLSILFPALGAFFNMLADLFQWDRLVRIYREASRSLEVADAVSPDMAEDNDTFTRNLVAYATGTLRVMRDESAQWGQLIRPIEDLREFEAKANNLYQQIVNERLGSESPGARNARPSPPPEEDAPPSPPPAPPGG